MKLSDLSETLIGSEIVKLGGEIREKIRQGQRIYNFTVGDFDPEIFPSRKNWKTRSLKHIGNTLLIIPPLKAILTCGRQLHLS
jgi:hypothetical protein